MTSAYLNALMEEGTKEDCFREVVRLHAEKERLRDLVQTLLENEPDDIIADGGITVLDQWRKDARRALDHRTAK